MEFLLYLALGACAGVLAGLFGVGGGIIIVPVLVFSFTLQGFDQSILTHLAVGTSLATIIFTSVNAVREHHRRGAVRWAIFRWMTVGILLGCMGLGGLLYALTVRVLVRALGERGLAFWGGVALAVAFVIVASGPLAAMAPAIALLGLGLHMLHNTLQTNATQMTPEARGLAVSTFANVLFLGQAAGVWLAGQVIDRSGFAPVFVAAAAALLAVGAAFALMLHRRPAPT